MSTVAKEQQQEPANPWAKYEELKAQLSQTLSPEQREEECRRIADELGI